MKGRVTLGQKTNPPKVVDKLARKKRVVAATTVTAIEAGAVTVANAAHRVMAYNRPNHHKSQGSQENQGSRSSPHNHLQTKTALAAKHLAVNARKVAAAVAATVAVAAKSAVAEEAVAVAVAGIRRVVEVLHQVAANNSDK